MTEGEYRGCVVAGPLAMEESDEQILDLLACARQQHSIVICKCENADMAAAAAQAQKQAGNLTPAAYPLAHPAAAEAEAILLRDAPMIPLYQDVSYTIVSDRVILPFNTYNSVLEMGWIFASIAE